MHSLGHTRTSYQSDHALLTPDTFVRSPLPGMNKATAIVHTAPAMGAAFTQYTAEVEPGGNLGDTALQRFIFVLEGELVVRVDGLQHNLKQNAYAYLPPRVDHSVIASTTSRAAVVEKRYVELSGSSLPQVLVGTASQEAAQPLMGDDALSVQALLPADASYDMAVNTMSYLPGASLPMVESHVMEHGLLMLEGGGIYRLNDKWYPVTAGDFIWMAPYCPQWFCAVGKSPARYLIYKDWNRHPCP